MVNSGSLPEAEESASPDLAQPCMNKPPIATAASAKTHDKITIRIFYSLRMQEHIVRYAV